MLRLILIKELLILVKKISLVSVAVLVTVLCMFAPPVHACSCDSSVDWGLIGAQSGRLPANTAGVAWYKPEVWFTSEEIRDNENLAARFTVEIRKAGEFRFLPVKVSPVEDFPGIYV